MYANLFLYLSISTRQANFRFSQQVTTISIGVGRLNRHGSWRVVRCRGTPTIRMLCVVCFVVSSSSNSIIVTNTCTHKNSSELDTYNDTTSSNTTRW